MIAEVLGAVAQPAAGQLNAAEKLVAERITAGEVADLTEQFPDEQNRKLSAHFLEGLLTGTLTAVKPNRNGVRIIGATIEEPIDVTNAQIPWEVWLDYCQFMSAVTFKGASFRGLVSVRNSTFKANADFNSMKVGGAAFFRQTGFEGRVDFGFADIASSFEADEAQFNDKENEANFAAMKVGGLVFFRRAVFQGPVNFGSARIEMNFEANEARFNDKQHVANFNSMKVGHTAFFTKAVFEGPVNFGAAEFGSNFEADDAQFNDKQHEADLAAMKVGGMASLRRTVFEGPVNFVSADIASSCVADEAQFRSKEYGANFNSVKVGHTAFFRKALFAGPVDFGAAEFASNFEAQEAQFTNDKETVWLCMKCGRTAFFTGATFAGPVSLADSNLLDLMIGEMKSGAAPIPQLDLSRTLIKRQLQIKKVGVRDFIATSLHVEGPADFTGINVEQSADLSDSDFAALDLSRSNWPKDAKNFRIQGMNFRIQGMNYKYLRAAENESDSHRALLKLAGQATYNADVYGNLEAFFKRQGYSVDADRAFIAGKRRERSEYLSGSRWFGSLLIDWLVGYGRRPWKAGVPCAFFVGLGCLLFSPSKMEPQKPDDAPRVYNRFWYSLDLFLPFVNLQADDVWKPKPDSRLLRHYVRLHVMLGWILIPIVLAALTGLIK